MFSVLIVDDNPIEREFLRFLLEENRAIKIVGEAEDGPQVINLVANLDPDIVFLDINMPGMNGVEIAKEIIAMGSKAFIVFVTVESKYAVDAFELDTVDYLLKPFDHSRLRKTMIRIRRRLAAQTSVIQQKKSEDNITKKTRLFLRSEGDILAINVQDIIFIEKNPEKRTIIHTSNGVYGVNKNIAEIQQQLSNFPNFVRSHKSYLINMDKVERITPWGDSSYQVWFFNYKKDAMISRKNISRVKEILSL